jgi:hypothetical protein
MSTATEETITVLDLGPAETEFPSPPPAADGSAPEAGTPPADGDDVDDDAPYGRKADGSPKAKPGRRPKGGIPRTAKIQPARPRKTAAPRTTTKKPAGPDYAGAVMGLLQLPAAGLALAGAKNPQFLADALTLELHGPPVAQALAEVAQEQPAVAAVLDRLMHVGPYGALIAAVSPLIFQVAANHGLFPAGQMGTRTLEQMAEIANARAK